MKRNPIYLSVQSPCHEKWSDMSPTTTGAFCQSCQTEVVDFSRMSDRELIDYLSRHKTSCGRFRADQVDTPLTVPVVDNGAFRWRALLLGLLPVLAWRTLPAATPTPTLTDQGPAPTAIKKDTTAKPTASVPDVVLVCGQVRDYAAQPVARAEVAVHYPAGGQTGNGTRTDTAGYFELRLTKEEFAYGVPYLRVANEKYEVREDLTREAEQNYDIFLGDRVSYMMGAMSIGTESILTVPGHENIFKRIRRAIYEDKSTPATEFAIYGTVWGGRKPLQNVSIRVVDSANIFYGNGAVTDSTGAFSIHISRSEHEQRNYHLEISSRGRYERSIPIADSGTKRLDLSLPLRYDNDYSAAEIEDISRSKFLLLTMKWRYRQFLRKLHHK